MACSYNNQPAATARPQAPAYPFQCPNTRPGTLEQSTFHGSSGSRPTLWKKDSREEPFSRILI